MANLSIGQIANKISDHLSELSRLMRLYGEKLTTTPEIAHTERKSSSKKAEFSFTEEELQTFEDTIHANGGDLQKLRESFPNKNRKELKELLQWYYKAGEVDEIIDSEQKETSKRKAENGDASKQSKKPKISTSKENKGSEKSKPEQQKEAPKSKESASRASTSSSTSHTSSRLAAKTAQPSPAPKTATTQSKISSSIPAAKKNLSLSKTNTTPTTPSTSEKQKSGALGVQKKITSGNIFQKTAPQPKQKQQQEEEEQQSDDNS